jgi:hypothetical protein
LRAKSAPDSHEDVAKLVAALAIFLLRPILVWTELKQRLFINACRFEGEAHLNELGVACRHQLPLEARVLGKLEGQDLLEHEQLSLRPVVTYPIAVELSYMLGVAGIHDDLRNGGLVLKKLEDPQQKYESSLKIHTLRAWYRCSAVR